MYQDICLCYLAFRSHLLKFSHPLFDEIQIAEDQSHVDEEDDEADQEERHIGVHHVVNLVIVAESQT